MHAFNQKAALALGVAAAIAGCTGKAGKDGAPGADLRPPMTAETCTYCHAKDGIADPTPFHDDATANALAKGSIQILSADFTAGTGGVIKPSITFRVFDRNGAERKDLTKFNFTATELIPATATMAEHWESYIWATATGFTGGTPSREAPTSVTYDTGSGYYAYTFTTDLSYQAGAPAVGSPPTYDAASIQRIGVQLASDSTKTFDYANGVADFDPGTTAPRAALSREIASTAACNACHGRLTIHGRRVDVQYCTTCHNPGLVEDGNLTGDLGPYVHKIHGREKLTDPTVAIMGGVVPEEITYPQDVRHCTTCHAGPDGGNWHTNPSAGACGACHDSISFVDPPPTGMTLHTGGAATDGDCAGCHNDGKTNKTNIQIAHTLAEEVEATKIVPEFGTVTYTSATNTLAVQFRIGNPTVAPVTYYALNNSYFTQTGGASSLSILVAFANTDFTNDGATGTTFGQPINVNLLSLPAGATLSTQDASGYYTLTLANALPASLLTASGAVGGTVAIQGHPAFSVSGTVTRIPMKNASKSFTVKLDSRGNAPAARRAVVNLSKCNACHFNLRLHGDNRQGDITTCTTCHNTDATDGSRRPNFATAGALGVDGKLEEGIDFKYMIHSIHGTALGGAITVYGYGGSVNDFSKVAYPNSPANCQACHDVGTYQQPADAARGTSTFAGSDRASSADNLRTTKGLATCGACHAAGTMQSHMTQMGGARDVTQAQIDAVNN